MTAGHYLVLLGVRSRGRPGVRRQPLLGRTVAVVGGADGSGAETARLARAAGGEVTVADAAGPRGVERFLDGRPGPIDHLVVTLGRRADGLPVEDGPVRERLDVDEHLWGPSRSPAPPSAGCVPGGPCCSWPAPRAGRGGRGTASALQVARRTLVAGLATELFPIRVNLIGSCLVDKPLSARLLAGTLVRGDDLRSSLPLARVVCPSDVAELAVQLMAEPAVTGASYDIDAGRRCRATVGPLR